MDALVAKVQLSFGILQTRKIFDWDIFDIAIGCIRWTVYNTIFVEFIGCMVTIYTFVEASVPQQKSPNSSLTKWTKSNKFLSNDYIELKFRSNSGIRDFFTKYGKKLETLWNFAHRQSFASSHAITRYFRNSSNWMRDRTKSHSWQTEIHFISMHHDHSLCCISWGTGKTPWQVCSLTLLWLHNSNKARAQSNWNVWCAFLAAFIEKRYKERYSLGR